MDVSSTPKEPFGRCAEGLQVLIGPWFCYAIASAVPASIRST
jgi:hypothetical protein